MKHGGKYVCKSVDETGEVARKVVATLTPHEKTATVLGLYGDLGSGKTTFTQALAQAFGVQETVTSPTFILEKIYKLNSQKFSYLIHIDAYRLENSRELDVLGWRELIRNPENLIVIEWPERVADMLPDDIQKIQFTFIDNDIREIKFHD